jgi:hypothetical protein
LTIGFVVGFWGKVFKNVQPGCAKLQCFLSGCRQEPVIDISRQQETILVNFDRRYWILIGAAMFFAAIASASTLYLSLVNRNFRECNSVSAACFTGFGMLPCMVFGILSLLPIMVAIPYIFRQNEKPGPASVILMGIIVAYTAFDATNNISAIMGYYDMYHAAHTILSTTNNATGNIAGTGESLC